MKTITIGRVDCDIIISDANISRRHATISLVNGQYVYNDVSKNGTTINGRIYQNEKVVVTPGTPIFLANKVQLPWPQVLMLLPNSPVQVQNAQYNHVEHETVVNHHPVAYDESIGVGAGILSFLFPLIGFILYFVWKDESPRKAKQASTIAWISFAFSFIVGFVSAL